MCFSAEASFTAGAVLAVTGIVAITRTKSNKQLLFASIPFLFAAQQISEGFLWIALKDKYFVEWKEPAAYFFLFFAQVLWPLWVPLSVLVIEKDPLRKKWLLLLFLAGMSLSFYLGYCLLVYPVEMQIQNLHIHYQIGAPVRHFTFTGLLYLFPTIVSLLIPDVKKIRLLGFLILLSFISTWMFFNENIISVWCFFAAIISMIIISIISEINKTNRIQK